MVVVETVVDDALEVVDGSHIIVVGLGDGGAQVAVERVVGRQLDGIGEAGHHCRIVGIAVVDEGLHGLGVFGVETQGEDEVVDGAGVVAHLAAHGGAAHVYLGIVGVEVHGLLKQLGGGAEIVFVHGTAGLAEQSLGAAGIHALEAGVVGLGGGIVGQLILGVGALIYRCIRCGVERQGRVEVGQSLVAVPGLVVDTGAEHVGLKAQVGIAGGSVGQGGVDILQGVDILIVAVILVGAAKPRHVILGVGPQLAVIYGYHGLGDRIVYDGPGVGGGERRAEAHGADNLYFFHYCIQKHAKVRISRHTAKLLPRAWALRRFCVTLRRNHT